MELEHAHSLAGELRLDLEALASCQEQCFNELVDRLSVVSAPTFNKWLSTEPNLSHCAPFSHHRFRDVAGHHRRPLVLTSPAGAGNRLLIQRHQLPCIDGSVGESRAPASATTPSVGTYRAALVEEKTTVHDRYHREQELYQPLNGFHALRRGRYAYLSSKQITAKQLLQTGTEATRRSYEIQRQRRSNFSLLERQCQQTRKVNCDKEWNLKGASFSSTCIPQWR